MIRLHSLIFVNGEKIYEKYNELRYDAREEILKRAKDIAEDIFDDLLEEHSLEDLCRDIEDTLYSEDVDIAIRENADSNVIRIIDNRITTIALPEDVEESIDIRDVVAMGGGNDLDTFFQGVAYDAWVIMIRDALRKLLERKCEEEGLLKRTIARIRR